MYAIAVPFESTNYVLLRAFYSLKNTTWPAISSAVSCAFAVGCGYATVGTIGAYSLVLAYVIAQVSQTLFLSLTLRRELHRMRIS